MTPADLSLTVLRAVRRAVDDGELRVDAGALPTRVKVERPRPGGRGDYASNIALTLARPAGRAPLDIAEVLKTRLDRTPGLAAVDITGAGFLNFTLCPDAGQELVDEILRRGSRYGWREPHGETARPVHRADLRAAVTADALRRLLVAQGYRVRTVCEGAADPDWALLGVRDGAEPGEEGEAEAAARGRLVAEVAPLPVPYTARELLERLGPDAARWGLLAGAAHDTARLGDDLLRQQEGNPFFRVRYAHSRTRALRRNAEQLGFGRAPAHGAPGTAGAHDTPGAPGIRETAGVSGTAARAPGTARTSATAGPRAPGGAEGSEARARRLLAVLGDHPAVLAAATRHRAPDRVARHLEGVADALLDFQHTVLPRGDEKPSAAHRSRLALAEAAGTVLAGGLSLLGISAPDRI
ncbi:ArgS-related anticodon-binding protein NrtL [Streptomyces sp. NBC_01216]|uniref:ArgS-related anticodon-binding protein NrtL n=1 Tax=unclassified Streptomyces TaxID=2593676 RepID=UPI002E160E38|nr:DALR anticodon-binding domain-containing protein [Streptomyces sp. NBC_01216]